MAFFKPSKSKTIALRLFLFSYRNPGCRLKPFGSAPLAVTISMSGGTSSLIAATWAEQTFATALLMTESVLEPNHGSCPLRPRMKTQAAPPATNTSRDKTTKNLVICFVTRPSPAALAHTMLRGAHTAPCPNATFSQFVVLLTVRRTPVTSTDHCSRTGRGRVLTTTSWGRDCAGETIP